MFTLLFKFAQSSFKMLLAWRLSAGSVIRVQICTYLIDANIYN